MQPTVFGSLVVTSRFVDIIPSIDVHNPSSWVDAAYAVIAASVLDALEVHKGRIFDGDASLVRCR